MDRIRIKASYQEDKVKKNQNKKKLNIKSH